MDLRRRARPRSEAARRLLIEWAMQQPTAQDIEIFLEVWAKLDAFEATQRVIRGYGAGIERPRPIPAVIATVEWLHSLTKGRVEP